VLVSTPIYEIDSDVSPAGVLRVRLAGDFDMSVATELSESLVASARTPGVDRVVVDLEHTKFLDSHGLAALIAGFDAAVQEGRSFTVANAHGMVRQVLDITGLAEVLIVP
jgi:anti-anti-sigma factor